MPSPISVIERPITIWLRPSQTLRISIARFARTPPIAPASMPIQKLPVTSVATNAE
jgi:hypothetical protein